MQRTSYTEVNVKSPVRAKGKGGRSMGGTIRARVRRGLLEPLEKGQRNLAASVLFQQPERGKQFNALR